MKLEYFISSRKFEANCVYDFVAKVFRIIIYFVTGIIKKSVKNMVGSNIDVAEESMRRNKSYKR